MRAAQLLLIFVGVGLPQFAFAVPPTPIGLTPGSTSSPGPTISSTSVLLTFVAAGATYYDVGVRDLSTNQLVVDTTTTSTTMLVNLIAGRSYRWNVSACDSTGCSAFTTPLYFQIQGSVPSLPTGLSPGSLSSPGPTLGSSTVQIQWNAVTDATYYDFGIRDMSTGVLVVDAQSPNTFYSADLTPGRPYRWDVQACNAVDCSGFTSELYFQTPAVPTIPTIPIALTPGSTSSPGPTQISTNVLLTFSAANTDYYELDIRDAQTGIVLVSTSTGDQTYLFSTDVGGQYRWRVRACNTAGCSNYSQFLYFQRNQTTPPVPTGLAPGSPSSPGPIVSGDTGYLTFSSNGAVYYVVEVRDAQTGGLITNTATTDTTYPIGLDEGRQYVWQVQACRVVTDCSDFTAPLYFQAETGPAPP